MKPARLLSAICIALSMLLLASCSSLLSVKPQPFTTYSPTYSLPQGAATSATAGARVGWQLIVETPLCSATLDTARMLVMPTPGVLEVFPGARWRDTTPALLRSLVVQGFESTGRIVGIGSAKSGLRADYALAIELRDFQLEINAGKAQAAVRFQASLLDYTSNRVLATHSFSALAPATGADAASAFVAFETALNTVIPQLVEWTFHEGNTAHDTPASAN